MRKPHPSDAHDAKVLAEAVEFSVTILVGGHRVTSSAQTLAEAAALAANLELAWPGKRSLVYAMNASRFTVLVPRERWRELAPVVPELPCKHDWQADPTRDGVDICSRCGAQT